MTCHVVVLATPAKPEGAKAYSNAVQPLLQAAGIAPKLRAPVAETLTQAPGPAPSPATIMVLEFPSVDAAQAFFAQPAYQELIALRDDSFARMEIHILAD